MSKLMIYVEINVTAILT